MPPNEEPTLSLAARLLKLQGFTVYTDRWSGLEQEIASGSGYGHVYVQRPPSVPVARYAGHDVSDQPRDENGRWANVGNAGNAKQRDVADRAISDKPANRETVPNTADGHSSSANTDRLRTVLERFQALHPRQHEYVEPIKLVEETPNWENWERPVRWDGSTLKVRPGTSDFDVLQRLARSISQNKGYKKWLENQIQSGAIELPREHGELWPDGAAGAALRQKRNLEQWYEYMEAAGATPAEISGVKQRATLNDWFGPGGYVETGLGAVGPVAGAMNVRGGGNGGPLNLRGNRTQTLAAAKNGSVPKVLEGKQQNAPKPVTIKYKSHGDPAEFSRQLKAQEDGINKLSAGEVKAAIEKFRAEGRPSSAASAIKQARRADPEAAKGKAGLHNPDSVIGGPPDVIKDFGGLSENSSIGSQNRWLQPDIYEAVSKLPPTERVIFKFTTD